jgi:uncharacterized membrane protein
MITHSARVPDSRTTTASDRVFWVALAIKAIDGAAQLVGALLLLIVSPTVITGLANTIVTHDLLGNPNGSLAHHLSISANKFADGSSRTFTIVYLLLHAMVKLGLVAALWRKIKVAYPIAAVVLAAFVVYEIVRTFHTHSIMLPIFAAMDIITIFLIYREYQHLKSPVEHNAPDNT